jgi:hypothetical protein
VADLSKRGAAAQQLHDKLQKQLADVAAELAQLKQLTDTTEQVQQQAASLAEQLRLHDDAEALAVSEAKKQLQAWMLAQQHSGPSEKQAIQQQALQPMHPHQFCSTQAACDEVEDEVANVLGQLFTVFNAAGMLRGCPAGSTDEEAHDSRWAALLQQVQQLQASNIAQFKQCLLANHQLSRVVEASSTSDG